jgi:hypothetical protein
MDTTNSSSAQQRASQQIRKPVPIVNSKSIVGSRYVSFFLNVDSQRWVCEACLRYYIIEHLIHSNLSITILCISTSYSLLLLLTDPSIGEDPRFANSVRQAAPYLYPRAKGPILPRSFRKQRRLVPSCLLLRAPLRSSALEPRNGRPFHPELQEERPRKLCRNQVWTLPRSALPLPFSHRGYLSQFPRRIK